MSSESKSDDGRILKIAVPSIVSNITVPLLGLVDVAIAGHLGAPAYIGAIAVGGMLFNIIYWLFGFLRMGTSAMTSQAYGRGDDAEVTRLLLRGVGVAVSLGLCIWLLQYPIRLLAFSLIQPTDEVRRLATLYFNICIWGAPAVLSLNAFAGWFIGMQNSRFPMYVAITQNVVNIVASLGFVYGMGLQVEGIAAGTLIAQYAGVLMAVLLYCGCYRHTPVRWKEVWKRVEMRRFFLLNRDIFLRTLCLVAVTLFFTSAGAAQGEIILAVNTLLMQLFTLFSYVMDGFAFAGEALAGRFIGAGDRSALRSIVRRLFRWGTAIALLFTLLYAVGGDDFLRLLTDDASVVAASADYFVWALAIPLTGFAAFLWDGLFVGATASRQMLWAMFAASLAFFIVYFSLRGVWYNHALWLAFVVYLSVRSLAETWLRRTIPSLRHL